MLERGVRWKMERREKAREDEGSVWPDVEERKGRLIFRNAGVRECLKFLVGRAEKEMEGS
jgi:hypothetical protein